MAITEILTLPNQPAVGSVEYIPLGGNGFQAPQSAFMFDFRITGDASGGLVKWEVNRDERFEHIVSFLALESDAATAMDYILGIRRRAGTTFHNTGQSPDGSVLGQDFTTVLWTPPTMIDPITWIATTENQDTIDFKFKGIVYNFNIRASEIVPLGTLLASVPRSPTAI